MTEEAQRVALAEACGWKRRPEFDYKTEAAPEGVEMWGKDTGELIPYSKLPDYLHSLDAMHEAEKVLTQAQDYDYRATILPSVCGDGSGMLAITATAAQRAEAFLRTLNLWDNTK